MTLLLLALLAPASARDDDDPEDEEVDEDDDGDEEEDEDDEDDEDDEESWTRPKRDRSDDEREAPRMLGVGLHDFSGRDVEVPAVGLALEFRNSWKLGSVARINLVTGMDATAWDRTVAVANWGIGAGRWTTQAYRDVYDWSLRPPEKELKQFGSIFAYFGLIFGYMAVPVALVLSPFAAISDMVLGPTVSFHLGDPEMGGYAEVGPGLMAYVHPSEQSFEGAYGALLGVGVEAKEIAVGARLLYSPPGSHSGNGSDASAPVASSALVFRWTRKNK